MCPKLEAVSAIISSSVHTDLSQPLLHPCDGINEQLLDKVCLEDASSADFSQSTPS
jgi:hypothetical protein